MSDYDLFDDFDPQPIDRLRRSKHKSSKESNPHQLPAPSSGKPVDDFTVPTDPPLYTVYYLTVTTPHTDSFVFHGPHRTFAPLLPAIRDVVSNSPSAIEKLDTLLETPTFATEKGFTTFVVDLERSGYTVLHGIREVNANVFECLPAPVYVVTAKGPLLHDMGTGLRTVASGRPKGIATTSHLVGSFAEVGEARAAATEVMDRLVEGEEGVMRMENGETGGKRRWILMGMNAKAVWEVSIRYDDEVLKGTVGRFDELAPRGEKAKWRF